MISRLGYLFLLELFSVVAKDSWSNRFFMTNESYKKNGDRWLYNWVTTLAFVVWNAYQKYAILSIFDFYPQESVATSLKSFNRDETRISLPIFFWMNLLWLIAFFIKLILRLVFSWKVVYVVFISFFFNIKAQTI